MRKGDITWNDSDKMYKIFLSSYSPPNLALLDWCEAVLDKLKDGKRGNFVHTLPLFPVSPVLSEAVNKCLALLKPEEKLYFIQGNEEAIKKLTKGKKLTENEGYWGIRGNPRVNGVKKLIVTRAYGLQRLARNLKIERDSFLALISPDSCRNGCI